MTKMMMLTIAVLALAVATLAYVKKKKQSKQATDYPTGQVDTRPRVIVSQDSFDSDNFSMIAIAYKMHKLGMIKLLAVDITGKDINNRASQVFSSLLEMDSSIPILVNQTSAIATRVTNSTSRFNLANLPNDGILDSQREDSTSGLARVIMEDGRPVTYIVGGHLTNLEYLMRSRLDIVRDRITNIVISSGWDSYTNNKPEMNLSQGIRHSSGASKATKYVFTNFTGNLFMTPIDLHAMPRVNYTDIGNKKLVYLASKGTYSNGKSVHMGDIMALLFGTVGTDWWDNKLFSVRNCNYAVSSYGSLTLLHAGVPNRYVLEHPNFGVITQVFKELTHD